MATGHIWRGTSFYVVYFYFYCRTTIFAILFKFNLIVLFIYFIIICII